MTYNQLKKQREALKKSSKEKVNFSELSHFNSVDWLTDNKVLFVIVPDGETAYLARAHNEGVVPFIVRFIVFSTESVEYIKEVLPSEAFFYMPNFSGASKASEVVTFGVEETISYVDFISLVEECCQKLKTPFKRFKMSDSPDGVLRYTSLEEKLDFKSLTNNYEGKADLFDRPFSSYVKEIMSTNWYKNYDS